MYFTGDEYFLKYFVYQPTFKLLQLKKDKGIDYIISWKLKGVCSSNLFLQHTVFLYSIQIFGYKIGIQFVKGPLFVEQNNYTSIIVNPYFVYDLDDWPKIPLNNFTLIFHGLGLWSFGNDFA